MNMTIRCMIAGAALAAVGIPTTAFAGGPGLQLSTVTAAPGQEVAVTATLSAGGKGVAGTQNDFSFKPPGVTVKQKANGKPDCTVNPAINKSASTFVFRPAGCSGDACNAVRVLVFSTEDVAAIPDGSALYTCTLQVGAKAATGAVPLELSGTILSDPTGSRVCGSAAKDPPCAGNVNGSVTVGKAGAKAKPAKSKR